MISVLLVVIACREPAPPPCNDQDGDSWCDDADCSDISADIHPGQLETWYNGPDDACDGGDDYDADLDDWPTNAAGDGPDCDDTNPTAHPFSAPICGNGFDDDCRATADCSVYGEVAIGDAPTVSILGGDPSFSADLDGDGRAEWGVDTPAGLAMVHAIVSGSTSTGAPVALLPHNRGIAAGELGGAGGDDVAYISSGLVDPRIEVVIDPESDLAADMTIAGVWSSVRVADVTADGMGDVVAWTGWREVDVFAGPAAGARTSDDATATLLWRAGQDGGLGSPADVIGDLTGDGIADIATIVDGTNTEGQNHQEIAIFPGPVGGTLYADEQGGVGNAELGINSSSVFDLLDTHHDHDLDGYDDLLTVDPGAWDTYRLLLGPFDGVRRSPVDADAYVETRIDFATVADVNGDGWPDLAGSGSNNGQYSMIELYGPILGYHVIQQPPDFVLTDPDMVGWPIAGGDATAVGSRVDRVRRGSRRVLAARPRPGDPVGVRTHACSISA